MKGSPQPGSMLPIGAVGGLSVTGCLSDFSFSVFHPYGGRKGNGYFVHLSKAFLTTYRHLV